MYEENNNNNYTYEANYTPTEPEKPKNNGGKKAGKIFALIIAVALIGGASGFGGALLANSMNSDKISSSEKMNFHSSNLRLRKKKKKQSARLLPLHRTRLTKKPH